MNLFISYSHAQSDWVKNRLLPCLSASGVTPLIDTDRFLAGKSIVGQMDAEQDKADATALILSSEYARSKMCIHEMKRATALKPPHHRIIPIRRDDTPVPHMLSRPNLLYVDLRDDRRDDQWDLLFKSLDVTLGTAANDWLAARDEIADLMLLDKSVNFLVKGPVRWPKLIDNLESQTNLQLARVDLQDPRTISRKGLVASILNALRVPASVPEPPEDLPHLANMLRALGRSRVVLEHFDLVAHRPDYDTNLFAAIRYLVMDSRQLVLLIQSRTPFSQLLPHNHPLSEIDLKTVELKAS